LLCYADVGVVIAPVWAERIVHDLSTATLRQPPAVEQAFATATVGLVSTIAAMETVVADLEAAMSAEFNRHPQAELLRGAPGLGPILAARVLAEIGDDPDRFATAGRCAPSPAPPRSPGLPGEPNPSTLDASATAASATLPLVGVRRAHQITRGKSSLRRPTSHRRRPQRRPSQPRQQTPRPTLVVSRQQPNVERERRLANIHNTPTDAAS
jgi:hypothetical protein